MGVLFGVSASDYIVDILLPELTCRCLVEFLCARDFAQKRLACRSSLPPWRCLGRSTPGTLTISVTFCLRSPSWSSPQPSRGLSVAGYWPTISPIICLISNRRTTPCPPLPTRTTSSRLRGSTSSKRRPSVSKTLEEPRRIATTGGTTPYTSCTKWACSLPRLTFSESTPNRPCDRWVLGPSSTLCSFQTPSGLSPWVKWASEPTFTPYIFSSLNDAI